jgi:hypothetical protein
MKKLLYIIAGLLVLIWIIIHFGTNPFRITDLLLPVAGVLALIQLIFNKKLSQKE